MKILFENWRMFVEQDETSGKAEPEHGYVVGNLQGEVFSKIRN